MYGGLTRLEAYRRYTTVRPLRWYSDRLDRLRAAKHSDA
jgi:hypothetical protein